MSKIHFQRTKPCIKLCFNEKCCPAVSLFVKGELFLCCYEVIHLTVFSIQMKPFQLRKDNLT